MQVDAGGAQGPAPFPLARRSSLKQTSRPLCSARQPMLHSGFEGALFEVAKALLQGFAAGQAVPACPACSTLTCGEVHLPPISVSCPASSGGSKESVDLEAAPIILGGAFLFVLGIVIGAAGRSLCASRGQPPRVAGRGVWGPPSTRTP